MRILEHKKNRANSSVITRRRRIEVEKAVPLPLLLLLLLFADYARTTDDVNTMNEHVGCGVRNILQSTRLLL